MLYYNKKTYIGDFMKLNKILLFLIAIILLVIGSYLTPEESTNSVFSSLIHILNNIPKNFLKSIVGYCFFSAAVVIISVVLFSHNSHFKNTFKNDRKIRLFIIFFLSILVVTIATFSLSIKDLNVLTVLTVAIFSTSKFFLDLLGKPDNKTETEENKN